MSNVVVSLPLLLCLGALALPSHPPARYRAAPRDNRSGIEDSLDKGIYRIIIYIYVHIKLATSILWRKRNCKYSPLLKYHRNLVLLKQLNKYAMYTHVAVTWRYICILYMYIYIYIIYVYICISIHILAERERESLHVFPAQCETLSI